MPETDLLLMTLVIFVPSVFAVGVLFFPRGTEEWMRWFALLGTAVTLVLSLVIFIDYDKLLDSEGSPGANRPRHGRAASLEDRAAAARVRGDQVLPVHPAGQRVHPRRAAGVLLHRHSGLRPPGAGAAADPAGADLRRDAAAARAAAAVGQLVRPGSAAEGRPGRVP